MENNIGRDWSWMMCDLCYIYFCTLYIITCHDIEGDNNDMVVIIGGNGKPCIVFSSRSDISTTQSHCHCHCHCHCPLYYLVSDISTNRQERSRTGTLRATNYCSFFVSTFPLLILQKSESLFLRISPLSLHLLTLVAQYRELRLSETLHLISGVLVVDRVRQCVRKVVQVVRHVVVHCDVHEQTWKM